MTAKPEAKTTPAAGEARRERMAEVARKNLAFARRVKAWQRKTYGK